MKKGELISLLKESIILKTDQTTNEKAFQEKCCKIQSIFGTFDAINSEMQSITKHFFSNQDVSEWHYLIGNFYIVQLIGNTLEEAENTELLSVKEMKELKSCLSHLLKVGIITKLLPKIPYHVYEVYTKTDDMFYQYNVLKCSILAFESFLKNNHLKPLILPEGLRIILAGLYQIAFCPLSKNLIENNTLLYDKQMAQNLLKNLKETIHSIIYIKETMVIFRQTAPPWFKKRLSQTLTDILVSPKGVQNVALTMFDDNTQTWLIFDALFKLISSTQAEIRENLNGQILGLIYDNNDDDLELERFFVVCTKRFYLEDSAFAIKTFVDKVLLSLKDLKFIVKGIRILHALFIEDRMDGPCLPIEMLKPVLQMLFMVYSITKQSFEVTHKEAKTLLIKYIKLHSEEDREMFVGFMFAIYDIQYEQFDNKLGIKGQDFVFIKNEPTCESLLELFEDETALLRRYFKYLLTVLIQTEKFKEPMRQLQVFNDIVALAENKLIQKDLISNPMEIILFIQSSLNEAIKSNTHRSVNFESDKFQILFTIVMILSMLTTYRSKKQTRLFSVLEEQLNKIKLETSHKELVSLTETVLSNIWAKEKIQNKEIVKSELDIVLEDVCDALLPVRGHGLMALKKLVEKRDQSVLDKKQYILTIFQQNLTNNDSFIYLNAIEGLAAMCNIFTDTVINVLCEEFLSFDKKFNDSNEVRMKLGEVLVKVSRNLGEIAPKYKALLLNTFLMGTKDDDYLVRASSLSNLGEICRVLGYKLGTMITEVLMCVNAVILTDKAMESRRAAVSVLRQLLAGLEKEMIAFLKEDILPIYRTLKQIYNDDKDDIIRLQAQLALEELNENMNELVFPKLHINSDKKIIILK
ncbi:transport and Golgi organization protein 6 homolog [Euwallacea fornicatus]|uniref:transport and Golgi organization protein 6 homolog n=1 Tax=Euwallacea fornicatus TaxID=995702 RepID=UPI003390764B